MCLVGQWLAYFSDTQLELLSEKKNTNVNSASSSSCSRKKINEVLSGYSNIESTFQTPGIATPEPTVGSF